MRDPTDERDSKLIYSELSGQIIGCAMTVLNTLRPGLDEKAYENALVLELQAHQLVTEQQRRFEVRYRGALVDILVPDLIVAGRVIVDPKVVEEFHPSHIAQMTGYLAITQLRLALLLNFKHRTLQWKRVIR